MDFQKSELSNFPRFAFWISGRFREIGNTPYLRIANGVFSLSGIVNPRIFVLIGVSKKGGMLACIIENIEFYYIPNAQNMGPLFDGAMLC